jgi:tRNA-dihydrouridine synthase 3
VESDDRQQHGIDHKSGGKKNRGRNKKRPRDVNITADNKICLAVLRGEECPYEKCRFSHDLKEYLATRPPDIKIKGFLESCPLFERSGFCHFGCMCRFADCHINPATGANLGGLLKEEEDPVMNSLSADLRTQLRRNTYPFVCPRHKHANKTNNDDSAKDVACNGVPVDETSPTTNSGSDFSPLPTKTRKIVDFSNKVYVAPLSA